MKKPVWYLLVMVRTAIQCGILYGVWVLAEPLGWLGQWLIEGTAFGVVFMFTDGPFTYAAHVEQSLGAGKDMEESQ